MEIGEGGAILRNRLQESDREEFIIDVTQNPEEIKNKEIYRHYNIKTLATQEFRLAMKTN